MDSDSDIIEVISIKNTGNIEKGIKRKATKNGEKKNSSEKEVKIVEVSSPTKRLKESFEARKEIGKAGEEISYSEKYNTNEDRIGMSESREMERVRETENELDMCIEQKIMETGKNEMVSSARTRIDCIIKNNLLRTKNLIDAGDILRKEIKNNENYQEIGAQNNVECINVIEDVEPFNLCDLALDPYKSTIDSEIGPKGRQSSIIKNTAKSEGSFEESKITKEVETTDEEIEIHSIKSIKDLEPIEKLSGKFSSINGLFTPEKLEIVNDNPENVQNERENHPIHTKSEPGHINTSAFPDIPKEELVSVGIRKNNEILYYTFPISYNIMKILENIGCDIKTKVEYKGITLSKYSVLKNIKFKTGDSLDLKVEKVEIEIKINSSNGRREIKIDKAEKIKHIEENVKYFIFNGRVIDKEEYIHNIFEGGEVVDVIYNE